MNQPLVTVSIAAYNVEKFLEKGIQYITNQTYQNLDIIIVDDGSTDNTPEICDNLALLDSRIRIFHKENEGSGSARNIGIEQARGEFIYFFDVDDSIELNFIEDSVNYACNKNVDLIIYGFYVRNDGFSQEENISIAEKEIHNNDELKKYYCNELIWLKHGNGFVWNKFYRLSFLKEYGFYFENQRIQQDEVFNMQLYPKLEHVYLCSKEYYHYVIYNSGNAGTRYIENKEDIIKDVYHKFMNFYDEWQIDDRKVLDYIQNRYISGLFNVASINYFHEKCTFTKQERRKKIDKILHDKELKVAIKNIDYRYNSNPINNLQMWSFRNSKTNIFILSIKLKKVIISIIKK